jgi:integrase
MALDMKREVAVQYRSGTLNFERKRYIAQRRAARMSEWSVDSDESVLVIFERFLGEDAMVSLITPAKLEAWRDAMLLDEDNGGEGLTCGTVRTYLSRVSAFFTWLKEQGGMLRNPVKQIDLPETGKARIERFCTKAQRDKLIKACARDDLMLVLMLGFHAGMRLNEIVQCRLDWLRFWKVGRVWHGEIAVAETATYRPKDKCARKIPMNRVLLEFLRQHLNEREDRDDVSRFLIHPEKLERGDDKYRWNPRRPLENLTEACGLSWVTVHVMRHTYATLLVMGGTPIHAVARWLGDGIEVTFNTYAGYIADRKTVDAGI